MVTKMKTNNIIKLLIIIMYLSCFLIPEIFAQCSPYLGQNPPNFTAKRFQPSGLLATSSWWWQSPPIFSPDGNEMYFVKYITNSEHHEIWYTQCLNSQWTSAEKVSFSTGTYDANPMFLQSNDTLYFYSHRPEGFIFRVTRISTGWSEPIALDIPLPENARGYGFSMTNNKTIYFSMLDESDTSGDIWSTSDIYVARFVNGQYTQPENLGSTINTNIGEGIGYVDPDERFIIFESINPQGFGWHDMYLSNRNSDGTWDTPINLGPKINGSYEDSYPTISHDGEYFFFVTQKNGDYGYNPYWIKSAVIFELVTNINDEHTSNQLKNFQLFQNYPNPFNPSTIIKYNIPDNNRVSHIKLKVYDVLGNEVSTLINKTQLAGNYEVEFKANNLMSGIYFYQLLIDGLRVKTRKMCYMK